jgi:hypothetical protein
MNAKYPSSERGQAMILIVLSCIFLFAAMGLVVDLGWAYFHRETTRAAAEAAAMAAATHAVANGGSGFTCGLNNLSCAATDTVCANPPNTTPPLSTSDVACIYAKANGYLHGGTGNFTKRVSYQCGTTSPPPTVPGACADYWFTVRIAEPQPQLFSAILGNTVLTTSARATAAVVATGFGGCVYVLDPSADKALWETASGNLQSPCGVWVNSSSTKAVYQTASSTINATPAQVKIVGSYYQTGSATITPSPVTGASSFSDPLASMAAPSYSSSCDHTNFTLSGSGTLNPGTYCGGISITGSGSSPVTFNSGLYVMLGGGFNIAGSVGATGTGITVYLTGNSTYASKGISINGSGAYSFSAPTSGPYESMLFIQDRTKTNSLGDTITGTSGMNISGIVYLPNDALTYTGGSSASSTYTVIVCDTLKLTGLSYINANYSSLSGCGAGAKVVRLIE